MTWYTRYQIFHVASSPTAPNEIKTKKSKLQLNFNVFFRLHLFIFFYVICGGKKTSEKEPESDQLNPIKPPLADHFYPLRVQ